MKILLAFDGFDYSQPALDETARLAREEEAMINIVSVVPPTARGTKSGGHPGLPPHARDDVAMARDYLRDRGIDADTKIRFGDPADELIEEATEGKYDLAVAGSRGLSAIGGLLLGSVSRKLVKRMPCPLIVAGPRKAVRHEPAVTVG